MKKKILVLSIILIIATCLAGCVSYKNKNQIFDLLKKNGCIDVGDKLFDDYDDQKVVDQSPIPASKTYYIYYNGDTSYTIDYMSLLNDKKNVDTYRVRVETSKKGEDVVAKRYLFENRKIFWHYWKMYYIGPEE